MEEADFLSIEDELRTLCAAMGASGVMDVRHYYRGDDTTEGSQLLDPRSRVLAQLDSLDRFMSVFDKAVFWSALEKIQGLLSEDADGKRDIPSSAIVLLPASSTAERQLFDLQQLPDLKEVRAELADLRNQIAEA